VIHPGPPIASLAPPGAAEEGGLPRTLAGHTDHRTCRSSPRIDRSSAGSQPYSDREKCLQLQAHFADHQERAGGLGDGPRRKSKLRAIRGMSS